MTPDKKEKVIRRQIRIATHSGSKNREATAAARVLVVAEAQNMEQEARDNPSVIQHMLQVSGSVTLSPEQREQHVEAILARCLPPPTN